jgi:hypothetical protein
MSPSGWCVCDAEAQVFTLQEVDTILQCIVHNMPAYFITPFSYTINDVDTKSVVIKTSGNEVAQVTAGIQHETNTMCVTELKGPCLRCSNLWGW